MEHYSMPKKGVRPHTWKSGPDNTQHKKYRVWSQQKNQAQWREEGWYISFYDWCEMWKELWDYRGRTREDYCMSRKDWSLPWTVENVDIILRSEHSRRQLGARQSGWRSIAQKRLLAKRAVL